MDNQGHPVIGYTQMSTLVTDRLRLSVHFCLFHPFFEGVNRNLSGHLVDTFVSEPFETQTYIKENEAVITTTSFILSGERGR